MSEDKISFTEEAVKKYLDFLIDYWRKQRDDCLDNSGIKLAAYVYIDAYQSVRTSLFGELKPESE
jgi:hypothetical protein